MRRSQLTATVHGLDVEMTEKRLLVRGKEMTTAEMLKMLTVLIINLSAAARVVFS